jgi:hypothetical protein
MSRENLNTKPMKTIIKLKIVWVVIMLLLTAQGHSQGFYITVGSGYGLSAVGKESSWEAGESISNTIHTTTDTWNGVTHNYNDIYDGSGTYKRIKGAGSFGKGVQAVATFGYMFTENIGAELGFGYLIGTKITIGKNENSTTNIYNYIDQTNPANNYTTTTYSSSTGKSEASGNMLRIIPAVRFSAGKGSIKPYARVGMVISVANKSTGSSKDVSINNSGVATVYEREYKYSGGISLGFAAALGATYNLTDNFGIFAEIGIITQSWAPKKWELTKYTENGVDKLPDMTTYFKESEFVNSYSYSSSDINEDSPNKSIKFHYPFSSIGINGGLFFTFGGK